MSGLLQSIDCTHSVLPASVADANQGLFRHHHHERFSPKQTVTIANNGIILDFLCEMVNFLRTGYSCMRESLDQFLEMVTVLEICPRLCRLHNFYIQQSKIGSSILLDTYRMNFNFVIAIYLFL